MLSREITELITQTEAGTPAGKLMRHYWQPAALVDELEGPGPAGRCASSARISCSSRTPMAATA